MNYFFKNLFPTLEPLNPGTLEPWFYGLIRNARYALYASKMSTLEVTS